MHQNGPETGKVSTYMANKYDFEEVVNLKGDKRLAEWKLFEALLGMNKDRKVERTQKEDKAALAVIQQLSAQANTTKQEIVQLSQWLRDTGAYGLLKEENKTSSGIDWIKELKANKDMTYTEQADLLSQHLDQLTSNLEARREIKSEYLEGAIERARMADLYASVMPSDDPVQDFKLTGDVTWGPDGQPVFEKGSELEAIFDPTTITQDINRLTGIIKSKNPLKALEDSKVDGYYQNVNNIEQLNELLGKQEVMLFNLKKAGIDPEEGLDEDLLKTEAYTHGFTQGQRTTAAAQALATGDLAFKTAYLDFVNKNYDAAETGFVEQADLLGDQTFGLIGFKEESGQWYSIDYLNELAIQEDKTSFEAAMKTLQDNAPNLYPLIRGIMNERARSQLGQKVGSFYDNTTRLVSEYVDIATQFDKAHRDIIEQAGGKAPYKDIPEGMNAWLIKNADSVLLSEHRRLKALLDEYAAIGITMRSVGEDMANKIHQNYNSRLLNSETRITDLATASGVGDQYTTMKGANEEETALRLAELKALDFANLNQIPSENEMNELLVEGSKYQNLYKTQAEDIRNTLMSTQIDERADVISRLAGIGTYETYSSFDEFSEAAYDAIANTYSDNDQLYSEAKRTLDKLMETFILPDIGDALESPLTKDMMLSQYDELHRSFSDAGGYQSPFVSRFNIPTDPSYMFRPFGPMEDLYSKIDEISETLNQLSILGLTEGIEDIGSLAAGARNQ